MYKIYKLCPKFISRSLFNSIQVSNKYHQADFLYMPYNIINNKIYKYWLCIIDIALRFKYAISLTDKTASSVVKVFKKVYNNPKCPLIWSKLLIINAGSEFKSDFKELFDKYNIKIKVGASHKSQDIVERFNHTLAKDCFSYKMPLI